MVARITLPRQARDPLVWLITLLLAVLAWIPTLQQAISMSALRMYGTMGMTPGPFLLFWTLMMAAMMLPALAPTLSLHYTSLYRQTPGVAGRVARMLAFVIGYLFLWLLFGVPVFLLAALCNQLVLHAPIVAVGLGIALCIAAGCYQMTPLKQRSLAHCHPTTNHDELCHAVSSSNGVSAALKSGLLHGLVCLGCCGSLMLVMLAVGLMNLPWMLLVTALIFLEKIWSQGTNASCLLGAALIFFGLLAFVDPSLLPGLYAGHF